MKSTKYLSKAQTLKFVNSHPAGAGEQGPAHRVHGVDDAVHLLLPGREASIKHGDQRGGEGVPAQYVQVPKG